MQQLGYIYKIVNLINNKIYIGQTKNSYITRFYQHKSEARTHRGNHKLSNAIRKYGEDNFIVELIEECPYTLLDEREKYWINFYNSIKEGYNAIPGGQKDRGNFYELDNEKEIIEYYYQCHNQVETFKHFGITEYKFRSILAKNNLPTDYTNYSKSSSKKVKIVELNKEFDSEKECAQFFIDNNLCSTKKIDCAIAGVNRAVKNNKSYCKYHLVFA